MKSLQRRQPIGVATGSLLIVLGSVGWINLALSDNLADRTILKRSVLPEVMTNVGSSGRRSSTGQQAGNQAGNQAGRPSSREMEASGVTGTSKAGKGTQAVIINQNGMHISGFKPRLPTYYSQLVTPQQRQRIYWVQKRYYVEIEKLKLQINKYERDRDKYIHSCLTPEQQRRLQQLKGDGNSKLD